MSTPHPPRFKTAIRIASLGLFAWTAGCNIIPPATEDSTRYYLLSEPAASGSGRAATAGGVRVGLKAVTVAGYLKRREMVMRSGSNEIAYRDNARWAESLDGAIARLLRAGLLGAPSVGEVLAAPFPLEGERDYDVEVQVLRCEGAVAAGGGHEASFSALVDISTTGPDPKTITHHVFTAPGTAWNGKDYGQLAGLLSDAIGLLAADVAASIPARN